MFASDKLVYIQMQKTGCTHIARLLSELLDGEQIGKHNPATPEQLADPGKRFVSSIRNPWDWYLSLWSYGVQGKGGLQRHVTRKRIRPALKKTFRNPKAGWPELRSELRKDAAAWRAAYDRKDNVEAFRQWLRLVHDPANAEFIGEGYEDSAITEFCGFMTYRYLILCCRDTHLLEEPGAIAGPADLEAFDRRHCYIDDFIRQESLESDFCDVVDKVRPLTGEQRARVFSSGKTNDSERALSIGDFYDQASIDLVRERDRLVIEKFGYTFPK